jgi:dihydropteroate synthase
VLRRIRRRVKVPVSVDTTSARVAEAALGEGAAMVNDVSGFTRDPKLAKLVARAGVPCVLMHLPDRPKTMQRRVRYDDLMKQVVDWLGGALERAEAAGVRRGQVIVDPGIGFGKRLEHNLELLRRLGELRSLGRPILVGPSRKTFIGKVLGLDPAERLEGTLAACVAAARNGANILRVHDVKAAVRALRVADAIEGRAADV